MPTCRFSRIAVRIVQHAFQSIQVIIAKKSSGFMDVLSNGRKISEQFFPRTLIEMPYNKTFGCIIVQKKVSDNIHPVDDTKVGFQNLPRSDL